MASAQPRSERSGSRLRTEVPKRFDIQGIRAVAVLLVLFYHVGFQPLVGGFVGVDVFFVISGFLITGSLLKEHERKGRISLKEFYTRRAARILPAATVALVSVLGLTLLVLPMTRWVAVGRDAVASSFYVMNWVLAGSSVDYLARDQAPSPLQHYWTLSVEEQFYLFWPLLLIIVLFLAKRRAASRAKLLAIAFVVVAVPSLGWSIYLTSTDPGPAYFVTTTRVWELAIGAGLAIFHGHLSVAPRIFAAIVGWLGVVAVLGSALLYTTATPFPGYAALAPTLGTAAIIWAGPIAGNRGPAVVLSLRPMVWIGTISYSLYLWHWPMLVLAAAVFGTLSLPLALAVGAFSVIPAWLSYRFVETPFLNWSKSSYASDGAPLKLGLMTSLASIVAALLIIIAVPFVPPLEENSAATVVKPVATDAPPAVERGAELLFDNPSMDLAVNSFSSIDPTPVAASTDLPRNACLQDSESTTVRGCAVKGGDAGPNIALVGDSHAAAFSPGLAKAVAQASGTLTTYTKASCPFSTATVVLDKGPYDSCTEWGAKVTAQLLADHPDAVYVGTARYIVAGFGTSDNEEARDRLAAGFATAWKPLLDAGIPVISIRDSPRPDTLIPDCVAKNTTTLSSCMFSKKDTLRENGAEVRAVALAPGSTLLDLTPAICPGDLCPAVMDGLLMWRDGNHLTATFSATLDKFFAQSLATLPTDALSNSTPSPAAAP
ncbi:acyltransferase [Subtercola sp. Z020]|uniref:acyltransferase family protein n=1 Tax=Subtercola sp. Z020 TaxID=2080582 RepID=UPI000CE8E404|nr:acyltransferase family protein [Subtercola sp. Z020]PPF82220.1 acyltransferase [Subtercola sp. Z020]